MNSRVSDAPSWRARKKTARLAALALVASGALALSSLPAVSAAAQEGTPPASAWGANGSQPAVPQLQAGVNKPIAGTPSAPLSAEEAAWRAAGEQRRKGEGAKARSALGPLTFVPRGQGEVPWHRYSDTRLTDALVARVNLSTGNLMLAATDFDIAGVGQKLQLARTYNSFMGPNGQVDNWWQGYERSLDPYFNGKLFFYDGTGATVEFTKNADGTLGTPAGYSKDLKKNADDTYTLTDRKSGSKETYSSGGVLTKVTDKNSGTITVTQHEQDGRSTGFKLTETRSGRWIDLVKEDGTHWRATDSAGRTVSYELSSPDAQGAGGGNLVKTTDTDGKSTRYTYDPSNRVAKVTSPRGNETLFNYDAENRLVSMQRLEAGSGPTWTYLYNTQSWVDPGTTTAVDPDGDQTVHTHNADGEITKVVDPLGHNRSTTYKSHLVQTATDAMGTGTGGTGGNVTTYGWDARNNPTSAKLPTGANASAQYQTVAGTDLPTDMTDADGRKDTYAYDTAGNTLSVTTSGAEGGQRSSTYNPATPTCGGFQGQRCTSKDANGKTTSFTYDAKGNLTKVTPPAPLGVTTYAYDALGRLTDSTDGRGVKTLYTYDARDRVTKTDTSGYATVTHTYDEDGNTTSRTDASGTTRWTFDGLNRERLRNLQDASIVILAYTPGGEVDWYQDPNGKTDYTWDAAGRLTELLDPAGKKTTYAYNNNDKRTRTTYPGGTAQSVTLDASNRPTAIKTVAGTTTLVDLIYTYKYGTGGTTDGTKIRTRKDNATQTTTTYVYDSQGRLSTAEPVTPGQPSLITRYCYDKAGNRLNRSGSACPVNGYGYNDASQLVSNGGVTTGWSYDKAGNETAAAPTNGTARTGEAWTDHSQLKSITTSGTARALTHAGTDNTERTKLADTAFHHTALGLTGTTTAGVDTGFIREPAGTLNSVRKDGKSSYYLTDATGNVIGLVDEAGKRTHTYAYTPYGTNYGTPAESFTQPYRYAGAYLDPTGLYKMGARYYDPTLGRFTQPDPSGQETNPYLYAAGDPINRTDPSGLLSLNGVLDTVGKAGDAIAAGQFVGQLATGDYKAAVGTVISVAADKAFTAGCMYLTAGAGAIPCTVGGMAVGMATEAAYEDATS